MTTRQSTPPARPWGCALVVLAALLLIGGIWRTSPERAVREWPQPDNFRSLQFAADGALVLQDYTTLTWYDPTTVDLAASTPAASLQADGEITSFAISPDGQWVATGTKRGTLTLWTGAPNWHVAETLQLPLPDGVDVAIAPISFSADGRSVCWMMYFRTADWAKTIRIRVWDRVTHQDRFTLTQTVQGEATPFDYGVAHLSPDSQLIVLTSLALEVRHIAENRQIYRIARDPAADATFEPLAISPDQQWLASGGHGQATIRRFNDGSVAHGLNGPKNGYHLVAFSPDSRYLAVGAGIGNSGFFGLAFPGDWEPITIYQVADGRVVQTFQGHLEGAYGLAYSPTGDYLATYGAAAGDRTLRLWRVAPHNPFEPFIWIGSGLALLLAAVGRWIWQRRTPRA